LFTVDTLNRNGCGWNAFRDAYKAVAEQLENGTYKSPQAIHMKEVSTTFAWQRLKEK
jgi:argininosuccinate lyase